MNRVIIITVVLCFVGACLALYRPREARVGPITNIEGIPYPVENGNTVITEKLAHADVYLPGPLFAKQLLLTVTFVPLATEEISVGIRENSFWLSYPKEILYQRGAEETNIVSRTVTIPLTDKLPDRDGSLDVMFFAGKEALPEENPVHDQTLWHNTSMTVEVSHAVPSVTAVKDYVRRMLTREVPV